MKIIIKIPFDYGENYFKIYYKNELIGQEKHFKFSSWYSHDYKFKIKKNEDESFEITFEIKGPDKKQK